MRKSLRGGGNICSTKDVDNNYQVVPINKRNDPEMIELFIQNLSQKCENILTASQKISLQ